MVQLLDTDIKSREILSWQGLHLFHARMSSCSQKLRIFLNLKEIPWEGHELNLAENESYSDWFLGINPRGLVPVLVRDGEVHIESNDIISLLEENFPEPCLIPPDKSGMIAGMLEQEDELHLDLRSLSFRFVFGRRGGNKSPELLEKYRRHGGTIGGRTADPNRAKEADFYQRLNQEGLNDEIVRSAALKFRRAFDGLEERLAASDFLLGDQLTVIDIAWFVYASRLNFGGYPLQRLHPRLEIWRQRLAEDRRFSAEVQPPDWLLDKIRTNHAEWRDAGTMMADIAGF